MKRFTVEEDNIIINNIKLHCYNLQKAFKLSATELNRSLRSVETRWYKRLSKTHAKTFFICSYNIKIDNYKNLR